MSRAVRPVLVLCTLSLACIAVAQASVEPLSQTRQVTVFAIATNPDTFAIDDAQKEAIDFGLFDETVEITTVIEGGVGTATAAHRSELFDALFHAVGSFHAEAWSEPPGTFTEAFGQSLFNLTFAVDDATPFVITGMTDATGGGAVHFTLSGPGGVLIQFRNLGDGAVIVDETAALVPGTYQIGLNVGGFAQAPNGTGPMADGSFDLDMSFPGVAAVASTVRPPLVLSAYPNPTRGSVVFELAADAGETLTIFDVTGRRVRSLAVDVRGVVIWDGLTDSGRRAAQGVYLYCAGECGAGSGQRIVVVQ
jgi:hypothetical protein